MNSIWANSAQPATNTSPFATTGMAPSPGGGQAARFQSQLDPVKKPVSSAMPGLSPQAALATPADSSTDPSGAGANITANDFLTLLVTEMQNQDPTAQTDPNEYINQLVQINSLEQLISINQNLSDVLGAAAPPATSTGVAASAASAPGAGSHPPATATVAPRAASAHSPTGAAAQTSTRPSTPGNLSVSPATPAARQTAHALDGRRNPALAGHAIRDIPTRPLP